MTDNTEQKINTPQVNTMSDYELSVLANTSLVTELEKSLDAVVHGKTVTVERRQRSI